MDKNFQDSTQTKREELLKRELERKLQIEKKKEEQDVSMKDQDYFSTAFAEKSDAIEYELRLIEEGEIEKIHLSDNFDKIFKEIQILNKFLSVSTTFLSNYTIRKSIEKINSLEEKIKYLEDMLLPKKKFGFKSRKTEQKREKKLIDEVNVDVSKLIPLTNIISTGYSQKKNENLTLVNDDILKKDVELSHLENCTIKLFGNPSTMHITNINRCQIFCGPVSTSVFVENCNNCVFVFACQQLRIHSTHHCNFFIHVTSRAIIEDTDQVGFAPFSWKYNDLDKHFKMSGLDLELNNWNMINDFNWLSSNVPSPNWRIIPLEERNVIYKI
uniref:C-CAP/cofactor C-like domain-containing protein n=1 Tax=Clastoptera arizonana TaxID=38151 RepID=A0A1B6DSI0_9HEMI